MKTYIFSILFCVIGLYIVKKDVLLLIDVLKGRKKWGVFLNHANDFRSLWLIIFGIMGIIIGILGIIDTIF